MTDFISLLSAPVDNHNHFIVVSKPTANQMDFVDWLSKNSILDINFGNLPQHYSIWTDDAEKIKLNPDVLEIHDAQKEVVVCNNTLSPPPFDIWHINAINKQTNKTGKNVNCYIIDTGVDSNHPYFEGRATNLYSYNNSVHTDNNGHGTHCAGLVGGKFVGSATDTNIFAVKCFDSVGRSTVYEMVKAIDFVLGHYTTALANGTAKPSVVNMSFTGLEAHGYWLVWRMIYHGLVVVVAAGNDNIDLGDPRVVYAPAEVPDVITVGAFDKFYKKSFFSNYGSFIDIWAPGSGIFSTFPGNQIRMMDGTSMASPIVAGICCLALEGQKPLTSRNQVMAFIDRIKNVGIKDKLNIPNNIAKSVNLMVQALENASWNEPLPEAIPEIDPVLPPMQGREEHLMT